MFGYKIYSFLAIIVIAAHTRRQKEKYNKETNKMNK